MFLNVSRINMYTSKMHVETSKGKTVQTPFPAAVSTANPSIDILSHITALEGHFDVMSSLNMVVVNSESSEKTT
jgi:hypothetical protein